MLKKWTEIHGRINGRYWKTFFILLLMMVFFFSCKTAPVIQNPFMDGGDFIALEEGALVYIFADIAAARPVLDLVPVMGMDEKQSSQMLDMTDSIALALYPLESGRYFQMTAWGKYPSGGANFAFGLNREWTKQRSARGYSYWYSQNSYTSIVVNPGLTHVLASADDTPQDPISHGNPLQLPHGFHDFSRGSIIFCWLENPDVTINQILQFLGLPLQFPAEKMFISLYQVDETDTGRQYQALLRIETENESQARGLVSIISLAAMFSSNTSLSGDPENPLSLFSAILFANVPVQDGRDIILKTAPLSENDIASLINYFLVYFN